jgi:hypothetical protein
MSDVTNSLYWQSVVTTPAMGAWQVADVLISLGGTAVPPLPLAQFGTCEKV